MKTFPAMFFPCNIARHAGTTSNVPNLCRCEQGLLVAMFGLFFDGKNVVRDLENEASASFLNLNAPPSEVRLYTNNSLHSVRELTSV